MNKFTRILTVAAAVGAFAPLAANASSVGTYMYQPGPRIVHAQPPYGQASHAKGGRTAHANQIQAINRTA